MSFNKNIKNILYADDLKKSELMIIFLNHKRHKIFNILEIISYFRGTILLLLDDHLFSSYPIINKIIEHIGPNRIKGASIASIAENPFFASMPLSSIRETIIGWPISERFVSKKIFSDRLNRVLALGTLTYRHFNNDVMKKLLDNKLNCVHPDREYLYQNYSKSKYIDSKIPMRDYRFQGDGFMAKLSKRISNKYRTLQYRRINLPNIMNDYNFVIYPSMFDESPCLGMLEAMASGMILIGTNAYAYKSLGLIGNYNYISIGEKWM